MKLYRYTEIGKEFRVLMFEDFNPYYIKGIRLESKSSSKKVSKNRWCKTEKVLTFQNNKWNKSEVDYISFIAPNGCLVEVSEIWRLDNGLG